MNCFSRLAAVTGQRPCVACCKADRVRDDRLSTAAALRLRALTGQPVPEQAAAGTPPPTLAPGLPAARAASGCAQQARVMAPVMQRFNRLREALPSARAAADLNELNDDPGDVPSGKPCLTRLPVEAAKLNAALGLPAGTISDADLRNDDTGFRAAMYRDEGTGQMILVPRDTQPDSLVDWQANTRNGSGVDTPQYQAMRNLSSKLASNDARFDLAGYSKGGGLAQEGALVNPLAQVRVFNSAGIPDAALARTGQSDFAGLVTRTRAFSADGDFLTFMNGTSDPGQDIVNARFLRRELAGEGSWVAPIDIKTLNPATRGKPDPAFAADKASYLKELDDQIDRMQASYDGGGTVAGFPPVRAASKETIPGSDTWIGNLLGANGGQPLLGKLNQHKMGVVLESMEASVRKDRENLETFMEVCG